MKNQKDSGKERRRYPRIFIQGIDGFKSIVGAQVLWENGIKTDILDLSYTGAAMMRELDNMIEKSQSLSLKFVFAGGEPVAVESKVIRAEGKLMAVQFDSLTSQARLAFETFLNDNLLGLNLRQVDKAHFAKEQDFTQWLHGPKDTNVFIWEAGDSVEKAIVELDNQILVWNKGTLVRGKSRSDLVSAIEDYYSPVLYQSIRAGQDVDRQLLGRVVKILSQIQNPMPSVKQLLNRFQENLKS